MHLLLVGYAPDATRQALALCDRTFSGLPIQRRLLVWNGPGPLPACPDGWNAMRGSNGLGEFSGWQEGLETLGDGAAVPVIFANDTLGSHRHPSVVRRRALRTQLQRSAGTGVVGFDDQGSPPAGALAIAGLPLRAWFSTYCFSLPPAFLERIDRTIFDFSEVAACVPGGADEETFFSEAVSIDLQHHLRWWLFHGGWYRSAPLSADNAAALTLKARCICAELLLSARAEAMGFPMHDPMQRVGARGLEAAHQALFAAAAVLRRRPVPLPADR